MQTGYLYDPVFLTHTLRGHPENAARLEGVIPFLIRNKATESLVTLPFSGASKAALEVIHQRTYIDQLERLSGDGGGTLGPDTYVTEATYYAASMAAGASVAAAKTVAYGDVTRAFALVRPPGHHAYADHAEGFCLFNNIALAAAYTLGRLPDKPAEVLGRVMIIDWDVHHGNGTEAIFYDDPAVLYLSIHQSPLYPGTGRVTDAGRGPGRGYNINVPLPPGVGDRGYSDVFDSIVAPAAKRYQPQLILVSAGYDCHWRDQLAGMCLSLTGMTEIMRKIVRLSEQLCAGRLVTILEGGYDLQVMQYGVFNTLKVLQNESQLTQDPLGYYAGMETPVETIIRKVRQFHNLQ